MKKITRVLSTVLVALTVAVMSYGATNKNLVNYVSQHNHVVTNYDFNDY